MKNAFRVLIILFVLVFTACEEKETFRVIEFDNEQTKATNITQTTALLSTELIEINQGKIGINGQVRFIYSDYIEYFTLDECREGHYWLDGKCYESGGEDELPNIGTYTLSIVGLTQGKTYYYAPVIAHRDCEVRVLRGEMKQFKTLDPKSITVITEQASNITSSTVTITGKYTLNNGAKLREAGLLLHTLSELSYLRYTKKYSGNVRSPYHAEVDDLRSNTTYYYCAYAIDDEGQIYYGGVKNFRTLNQNIVVTTGDATNITSSSATLSGSCAMNNGAQLKELGILLHTSSSMSYYANILRYRGTGSSIQTEITGLQSNTTYYYCAYAIDDEDQIYYGSIKSFGTLFKSISVQTGNATNITSSSATLSGSCAMNNGAQLKELGILLHTSSSMSYYANILRYRDTGSSIQTEITGLQSNTTYYYCAYAIDDEDKIYYGGVKNFRTPMYKATLSDFLGTYSVKYDQGGTDFNEYDFPDPKDQTTCSSWNYNQTGTATIKKITAPSGASGQWVKMTFTDQDREQWALSGKYDENAYCICLYGDVAGDYTIPGLNASGAICEDCGVWAGSFGGHFTMPIYKSGNYIYLLSSGYGYEGSVEIRLVKSGPNAQIEFNALYKDKKFGYYPNGIGRYWAWCGSPNSQGSFYWGTMSGGVEYINLTFTK